MGPVPIQLKLTSTSKVVVDTSSKRFTVAFNAAESSFFEMSNSPSVSGEAEPYAKSNCISLQISYWEIVTDAKDNIVSGPGASRNTLSLANTNTSVTIHPDGPMLEKVARALGPLKLKACPPPALAVVCWLKAVIMRTKTASS